MKIIHTIGMLRSYVKELKKEGRTLGFVPTMGYLHEGHLSLIRKAKEENDRVVVSIFVNPIQFGTGEDFKTYPRDLERDSRLAESAGADVIFAPDECEMYPEGFSTYVENEGQVTKGLCGASRPGHFKGVTTVVAKLFNLVQPDKAYFGQKDAQQAVVIKQMGRDLDFDIEIVVCPIVREKDGLALSSRNTYLSEEERKDALILSQSLFEAEKMIKDGEREVKKIREYIVKRIQSVKSATIDYVEIVSAENLKSLKHIEGSVLLAVAAKIGTTRLIDNIRLEV